METKTSLLDNMKTLDNVGCGLSNSHGIRTHIKTNNQSEKETVKYLRRKQISNDGNI